MHILLADDEPTVRSALRLLLEQESWVDAVSEAGDSRALAAVTHKNHADLLLLDYEMAGVGPHADWLSLLHRMCPGMKVIALSRRPENASRALAAGADGFVSKSDPPEQVLAIVTAVAGHQKEANRLAKHMIATIQT